MRFSTGHGFSLCFVAMLERIFSAVDVIYNGIHISCEMLKRKI